MAYIVVNSTALENNHREIMSKLDKLTKRITRLETRLCIYMESNGVDPRKIIPSKKLPLPPFNLETQKPAENSSFRCFPG